MKRNSKFSMPILCMVVLMVFMAVSTAMGDSTLKGDINLDGKITSTDLLQLKQYLIGTRDLNGQSLWNADVNNDGSVSSTDLLVLEQIMVGYDFETVAPEIPHSSAGLVYPLPGYVTRTDSSSTTDGQYCDYYAPMNTPVYAPCDGYATFKQAYTVIDGVRTLTSYANFIEFRSATGGYTIKMCHLNSFNGYSLQIPSSQTRQQSGSDDTIPIAVDIYVTEGTLLGYSGMTGNASGPHLHIEVTQNGVSLDPAEVFAPRPQQSYGNYPSAPNYGAGGTNDTFISSPSKYNEPDLQGGDDIF